MQKYIKHGYHMYIIIQTTYRLDRWPKTQLQRGANVAMCLLVV